MTTDNFIVRPMNRSEIDLAITWAATEGWNPGRYDAESFYQTDENGFLLGELNGEPLGCISAIAYNQHFGFLGFYQGYFILKCHILCPRVNSHKMVIFEG